MQAPDYLLIIAGSGRMAAQMAKNAGLKSLVIDLFADVDTQHYATACLRVASLAIEHLTLAIDHFIERYGVTHAIYGSGFEYYPESLYYLNSQLTLIGNSPDTFEQLLNKSAFFSMLDQLTITYPEVTFKRPNNTDSWLVKPAQGQGGAGIKPYHADHCLESGQYFQKYQPGTQHSVLFLADERQAQVIGFNTQWTVNLGENQRFMFSGIINSCNLLAEQKALITSQLTQLVAMLSLKGLNSLDFIQSEEYSYVLEINPRLSASAQLYHANLLFEHIQASQDCLPDFIPEQQGYTAYQVVYARQGTRIPQAFQWPDGCVDLPESKALIRAGQPICSIMARQNNAQSVMKALQITQHNLIKGLYPHGI
ncbi:MAG: ATP-grasp domain-containing protein [Methylococcaceae bacterium]